MAQTVYDKLWKEVEILELDGKTRTASLVVENIMDLAEKDDKGAQIIKAFLYQSKFLMLLEEESQVKIIKNLEDRIETSEFPVTNILESIYASCLNSYFQRNRSKINTRIPIDTDFVSENFEVWDRNRFNLEVKRHFDKSLNNKDSLRQIPIRAYELILTESNTSIKLRPSLYDFLVHRYIDFCLNNRDVTFYNIYGEQEYGDKLLAPSEEFIELNLSLPDSINNVMLNPLQLYQDQEIFYRFKDTVIYANIMMHRLHKIHGSFDFKSEDSVYINSLKQSIQRFGSHEVVTSLGYDLAKFLYDKSFYNEVKYNKALFHYRKEAFNICENQIMKFPNSPGASLCEVLNNRLGKKDVRLMTEEVVPPDLPFLAKLDYQNVDSLYINIYEVPMSIYLGEYPRDKYKWIAKLILDRKPIKKQFYELVDLNDYHNYSTEINLPELPIGNYLIVASSSETPINSNEIYSYVKTKVSRLSFVNLKYSKYFKTQILNRLTGEPLSNVNVKIEGDSLEIFEGKSNKNGEVNVRLNKEGYYNLKIYAALNKDTLISSLKRAYRRGFYEDEEENHIALMQIYTDRKIYRPGQTIFFKGMLLDYRNGRNRMKSNTHVSVRILDSRRKKLKEFRLKTNEFGSVSGKYQLPKGILTGRFRIVIEEDNGDDNGDYDRYYDRIDDYYESKVYFSVEEYKRPRFEVSFDKYTDNKSFGDSIHVKGRAEALMGSSISDANVKYRIRRKLDRFWLYNKIKIPKDLILTSGTTLTDAQGNFEIAFVADVDSLSRSIEDITYSYEIFAEVTDSNGETRTAESNVKIGSKNLELSFNLPDKMNSAKPQKLDFSIQNLNRVAIPGEYEISIYQLKSIDRVVRDKPWQLVDKPYLDRAEFIELFPFEVYDSLDLGLNLPRINRVFHQIGGTDGEVSIELENIMDWSAGQYEILIKAFNNNHDSIQRSRRITVFNNTEKHISRDLFDFEILDSNKHSQKVIQIAIASKFTNTKVFVNAFSKDSKKIMYSGSILTSQTPSILEIPINQLKSKKVELMFHAVKQNDFYSQTSRLDLSDLSENYQIDIESFRGILTPDSKEKWKFKVSFKDEKNYQVELLASMYDRSLDAFATQNWEKRLKEEYYGYYSNADISTFGFDRAQGHYFRRDPIYTLPNVFRNYHRLNWFGFDFQNVKYSNRKYLKLLEQRIPKPDFNGGNVSGVVTELATGFPAAGVTVLVAGTKRGTQTDFDGFYSLNVKKGEILKFSFVGFMTAEQVVGNSSVYNVTLEEDVEALDEVVIVGYGSQVKRLNPFRTNILETLAGEAAGVTIINSTGQPGTVSKVRIRGYGSVNDNRAPLYVVDGVPVDANQLIELNASNIAGTSILKDATATAIYGSRGANGVVLITTKQGIEELTQVEARTNLKETAFFYPHLKSNKQGEISFSFEAPQALTKWRMMLLAHDKKGRTGYLEQTVVTQKQLSVTPNPPRFLRETDTIRFSAKISNLTDQPLAGSAMLQILDGLSGTPLDSEEMGFNSAKSFTTLAKGNDEVSWTLVIPKHLNAIQYKVLAKSGNFSDGEGSVLPVLSNRTLLTESKPIWVTQNQLKNYGFEKLKNTQSKTRANHKLSIEYTTNPSWLALKALPYLMEYPYQCAEQTFSRFYANALGRNLMKSNPKIEEVFRSWQDEEALSSPLEKNDDLKSIMIAESPWIRDLQSDKEQKARLARFFQEQQLNLEQDRAIAQLKDMQLPSGAFPWFAGGNANKFITRHIVAGIGHLRALNIDLEQQKELIQMEIKAIKFLDEELVKDYHEWYRDSIKKESPKLNRDVIHYLYTRSFTKDSIAIGEDTQKITSYYMNLARNEWLTQSLYNKGLLALIFHRNGDDEMAEKIITSLEEQTVRSDDRGWYWKENKGGWYWYNSAIETQAVLIEAFSEISTNKDVIDQLKLWLLYHKQGNHWDNSKSTTEAIYALLMNGNEWMDTHGDYKIVIGGKQIPYSKTNETKNAAETGYVKLSWKPNEMNSDFADIRIENNNTQPVMGGVYWQYFEDLDRISSSQDSPLAVTKELYLKQVDANGEKLVPITTATPISIGDVVTVRLKLTAKDDMEYVHLKDLRAAGFEPMDVLSKYKWQDGLGYYQATSDVATDFFFDRMSKGSYIFQYDLRANNSGSFSNGFAKIQSMYAPQFGGNSEGKRVTIKK